MVGFTELRLCIMNKKVKLVTKSNCMQHILVRTNRRVKMQLCSIFILIIVKNRNKNWKKIQVFSAISQSSDTE